MRRRFVGTRRAELRDLIIRHGGGETEDGRGEFQESL